MFRSFDLTTFSLVILLSVNIRGLMRESDDKTNPKPWQAFAVMIAGIFGLVINIAFAILVKAPAVLGPISVAFMPTIWAGFALSTIHRTWLWYLNAAAYGLLGVGFHAMEYYIRISGEMPMLYKGQSTRPLLIGGLCLIVALVGLTISYETSDKKQEIFY